MSARKHFWWSRRQLSNHGKKQNPKQPGSPGISSLVLPSLLWTTTAGCYHPCLRRRLFFCGHHAFGFYCSLIDLKPWCWDAFCGLWRSGQKEKMLRAPSWAQVETPMGNQLDPKGQDSQCREGWLWISKSSFRKAISPSMSPPPGSAETWWLASP